MPQRHRHLRRPRRAVSASTSYNDKSEMALAARADARRRRRLRRLRREGRRALRAAARTPWPSPRRSAIPRTTGSRRRRARSRSTRWRWRPSPIPTGWAPFRRSRPGSCRSSRRRAYPLMLCSPSRGRARIRSTATSRVLARIDPRRRLDAPDDAGGARHRRRRHGARVQRPRRDRCCRSRSPSASRRAWCRSRRAPGSRPDGEGTDTRGCANVLTDDRSAPCGATTYNTNLVEIAPVRVGGRRLDAVD